MKVPYTSLYLLFALVLSTTLYAEKADKNDGKTFFTWEQIHKDSDALAEKVRDQGPFEGVVAIARGGYIPAVIVAHKLGIKKVVSFSLSSYTNDKKQSALKIYSDFKDTKGRWLVIDELVDSGKTLEKIRAYLPKSVFAVLYAKPKGAHTTDYYAKATPQDTWLVFPWEHD